jgi:transcriptional regulator with XRE-family HTH domain
MTMLDSKTWTLADRLKKSRQLAGLDQDEMAKRLGIARNTISSYETGKSEPSATTFVLWAGMTGATLEWLAAGVVRPEGFEPPTY